MWNHWTVRSNHPYNPFLSFDAAAWTWKKIHRLFPETIAAVLMPNHLHLILPTKNEKAHAKCLHGLQGGVSKITALKHLWQPTPCPTRIPDRYHLRRQIRYVALNPCRKNLCADPLEWFWSSYRETMGASLYKFESTQKLAQILDEPTRGFKVRFHSYVSGDPSVNVGGTPAPTQLCKLEDEGCACEPILDIRDAAAAAVFESPQSIQKHGSEARRLFIHLAYDRGWSRPALLAKLCKASARAVLHIRKQAAPFGLDAAMICLGDGRFRQTSLHLSQKATNPRDLP